ncbi:predicted protein, partial [Nematostella vectensis]
CPKCGTEFTRGKDFRHHLKGCHECVCTYCYEIFNHEKKLKRHINREHTDNFKCSECGKKFSENRNLRRHKDSHVSDKFFLCSILHGPMVVIPNIPKIHMVQPEQKPVNFICQLCEAELPSAARLTEHIMRHQPSGSRCPICQRHFSRRVGLRFHVQTHSGDKPHQCHLCEKAFTKPASLVAHIRTHSSERPYVCSECNKGFTHPSNLTSHMKTHSDNRPFQCSDCDKGFKTSSHLALHRRVHTDERPYPCSHCGKKFKNSCHLSAHMRLHT